MNKVAVVGSYNVDMTITTKRLPQPGETILGDRVEYGHGGKGANQAVAATRIGAQVGFLAKVGRDEYGEKAKRSLSAEGITTTSIIADPSTPTGMAFITVNHEGDNSIVVISGANWTLSGAEIHANSNIIKTADVLLTQLETPMASVAAAIKIAKNNGVKVILNPAPAQGIDPEILKDVDILTPNRVEAEMLTGVDLSDDNALPKAADILHQQGVEIILITLGCKGVFVSSHGRQYLIPAIHVQAVDTVGAGDVFSGVLAALYSGPENLEDTVTLAIAAASMSVLKVGAQTAIPHWNEVKSFLKDSTLVESS